MRDVKINIIMNVIGQITLNLNYDFIQIELLHVMNSLIT